MPYSIDFINELEKRLCEFIKWGESKGINFEGSRVLKYVDLLRSYREALGRDPIEDLMKSRGAQYLDQVPYEIAEIIYLFESLRDFKDQRLKTRFQSAIQGPELLEDDVTGSFRDTVFELEIAALLYRARMNGLRFDPRHDLVCSLLDEPLIIECKRPRSNETIRDLYASGAHQIETSTSIRENPNTKGIVALDLTQTVLRFLGGSRYSSTKEMEAAFTKAFVRAWSRMQITIADYSDRVSALHLFSRAHFYLEVPGSYIPFPARQNLIVVNTRDHERNKKIALAYGEFLKRVSNTSRLTS
jgi:hypothetical protein